MPKPTARETAPISIAAIEPALAPPHTSHSRIIGVSRRRLRRCSGPGAAAAWTRGSSSIGPIPSTTIAQAAACGEMLPSAAASTGALTKTTSFTVAATPRARGSRAAATRWFNTARRVP